MMSKPKSGGRAFLKHDKTGRVVRKWRKPCDLIYERPQINTFKLLFNTYQVTERSVLDETYTLSEFVVE